MLHGFRHQGEVELPGWAVRLRNYYWFIRVEGRDKAKRRRYYRLLEKEKLRLVEELMLDQETIETVCRYLSSFNKKTGVKAQILLSQPSPQLQLDFRCQGSK